MLAQQENKETVSDVRPSQQSLNNEGLDQTKIDVLRFCREEIRHEFSLLSTRMMWYVTCQSFLITAFAIFSANNFLKTFPWFNLCIAFLGIFTSYLSLAPIRAAHDTIAMWLAKQRSLFSEAHLQGATPENEQTLISKYAIERDYLPVEDDAKHKDSLIFTKYSPWIFIALWAVFIALNGWMYFSA